MTRDFISTIARSIEEAVLSATRSAFNEAFSTAFSADSIMVDEVLCSFPEALRNAAFASEADIVAARRNCGCWLEAESPLFGEPAGERSVPKQILFISVASI